MQRMMDGVVIIQGSHIFRRIFVVSADSFSRQALVPDGDVNDLHHCRQTLYHQLTNGIHLTPHRRTAFRYKQ